MTSTAAIPAHRPTSSPPGLTGGLVTPASGSMRLAGEHFAAALLFLIAGATGLVWIAPELAIGAFPSAHVAGITHLFTLGWLTTTIFGALYQLLPVALGAPIRSVRAGHTSFWTFVPGAALFSAGVASSSTLLHHIGIALITIAIVTTAANVGSSLVRARTRDVTWAAVAISLSFLLSTLVLGVILVHNLHTGFLAAARIRVLASHLHVAIVGFALVMIIGVSHRLLPMFLLAHGADARWTRRALVLVPTGVVALVVGLTTQAAWLRWSAVALLEGGIACFVWQAAAFHRARVRKKLDVGMRFAAVAVSFLVVSALMAPAVLARGASLPRLATAYVIVGLLGGIVLYVTGFFYKIVPLLAWTVRYRGRMGKEKVPTVAELYSSPVAHVQLALMALGVIQLGAGTALGHAHCVRAGAIVFLCGVLLFASQIGRVARGVIL